MTGADLRAAGVTLSPGTHAEMALLGTGCPRTGSPHPISPGYASPVPMTPPGDGGGGRRGGAPPLGPDVRRPPGHGPGARSDEETARAWAAAVVLVLPPQPTRS
ncbi:hypothetical protein HFP43_07725 [Streptomyces sp. SJ1-7]|nr:hypothetical protein [Streptomyces sp. SJ1-7]